MILRNPLLLLQFSAVLKKFSVKTSDWRLYSLNCFKQVLEIFSGGVVSSRLRRKTQPPLKVTGHFVPRSFRTQVISYHFWSFRTHFYFQFGHFVPSLVISYLLLLFARKPFWSFRTYFLLFRTQVISYPKSFRTHFSHFVPRSFRTHFQTRYELILVRNDFLFCCNLLLPDQVRIDFGIINLIITN